MQKIRRFSGYDPLKVKPGTIVKVTDIHPKDGVYWSRVDFLGKPATLLKWPKENTSINGWYAIRLRMHNNDPTGLPVLIHTAKFEPVVGGLPPKGRKIRLRKEGE